MVKNWFGHLPNEDLGFVSVVIGATSDLEGVGSLITRNRDNTRKRVAACRKMSTVWDHVYLAGWHEIDAVGAHHLPLLPPKRKALIEQMAPLAFGSNVPAWIGTWHGIIHLNGLPSEQIAHAFSRQWKLNGQVHVRMFDVSQPVHMNLDKVTSYANKFTTAVKLKDGFVDPWPVSWSADFFSWLHAGKRNAFEALRFTVSPASQQLAFPEALAAQSHPRQAMPCLFS